MPIDIYGLLLKHFSPWFLCWILYFNSHWCHSPVLPLLCYSSTFLCSFPFVCSVFRVCTGTLSIARRSLAAPVDSSVLSRLLTPTQASLARSKSAAALSAEGGDTQGNTRAKGRPSAYRNLPLVCSLKALCGVLGWRVGLGMLESFNMACITFIKLNMHWHRCSNVWVTSLAVFSKDAQTFFFCIWTFFWQNAV